MGGMHNCTCLVVSFSVAIEKVCTRFKKPNVLFRKLIYGTKKMGTRTHRDFFKNVFRSVHYRWDIVNEKTVVFQLFLLENKPLTSTDLIELKGRIKQVVFVPVLLEKDRPIGDTLLGRYPSVFRRKSL